MGDPMSRKRAIDRVVAMRADNGQTWDLSDKDREALRHAVNAFSDVDVLRAENEKLRSVLDEIAINAEGLVKGGLPHFSRKEFAETVAFRARYVLEHRDTISGAPIPRVFVEMDEPLPVPSCSCALARFEDPPCPVHHQTKSGGGAA